MAQVGLWSISDDGPQKLERAGIDLERQLEAWIENDPSLLEPGLTIVGRQARVDGGPLDLLAVDSQGRWVVIEMKRGTLYRDTLAQALDYAASIASMPNEQLAALTSDYLARHPHNTLVDLQSLLEEAVTDRDQGQRLRDVRIYLVGTSSDPGLIRLTTYLASAYNVPTSVVTYQVFDTGGGQRVLLRELTEADTETSVQQPKPRLTVEDVCTQADAQGLGEPFRRICQSAIGHGMYPRPYSGSIMYAPPSRRNRALFTVRNWPRHPGMLAMWFGPEAIAEFYPVAQTDVEMLLGETGWRDMTIEEVDRFVQGLDQLFDRINATQQ